MHSIPHPPAESEARPSHLRAYAEYRAIGEEVRALEERDVLQIAHLQRHQVSYLNTMEEAFADNVASLERDLESARLTLDYVHARQRQQAAADKFSALLDAASEPERLALVDETAVRA